jgi:outer membrane protein assembly factor BamD
MIIRNLLRCMVALGALAFLMSSCGLKRHPYDNPITKDTQQPDKVLFDKAIHDIEHSRYEIARLTLNTLINTYDTSEYLAKAKLAIADSWYREGGAHALAQAEAEYKDFILFYPQMEEAAEAQEKVCDIHFRQMEKADRDSSEARRAEDECRSLLTQFPNSKFAKTAEQKLREIQETLADSEFRVGTMYHNKGSFPAAANRYQGLANQFPLYSRADDALWEAADSYGRMGDRFENQQVEDYTRIVRDYPLSDHVDEAKAKLQAMNRQVPAADPQALAHAQYELENRKKAGIVGKTLGVFGQHPDVRMASKSGTPNMEGFKPQIPVSVPQAGGGTGTPGTNTVGAQEVSAAVVTNTTALDTNPDARAVPPGQATAATATGTGAADPNAASQNAASQNAPLPTNHIVKPPKAKKAKKNKQQQQATPAATDGTPSQSTQPAQPQQ